MAIDIIIRPEGQCLTLAFDTEMKPIAAVSITGAEIRAIFEDGGHLELGTLAESMRLDAGKCSICVVVRIDGDRIAYSHPVDLMSDR